MDTPNNSLIEKNPPASLSPVIALTRWERRLLFFSALMFMCSLSFPLIASFTSAISLPAWFGYMDAGLAFLLIILAMLLGTITGKKFDYGATPFSLRAYRIAAYLPLVLLVAFFIFGDRIKWNILLPGLAWRVWLLLYIFPSALTAWERR